MVFLLTVPWNIKLLAAKHVATCTAKSLSKHVDCVLLDYKQVGFNVCTNLMDGKFEKVKDFLPLVVCNTTTAKEHVRKVGHSIYTIKERMRGIVGTLPFEYIPWRLKTEFIYFVVLWLNAFPAKNEILATYSPRKLLVCWKLDYRKHY